MKLDTEFSGTIKKVLVDLAGERLVNLEAETRVDMRRQ